MDHRVLNFDLFMQEKKHETMTITIFGKDYEVSLECPAIVPVMMARAEVEKDPKESTRMTMLAADAMIGKENVDELCSKGLSARDLADLIQRIFAEMNKSNAEDEEQELTDEDSRSSAPSNKREKK